MKDNTARDATIKALRDNRAFNNKRSLRRALNTLAKKEKFHEPKI